MHLLTVSGGFPIPNNRETGHESIIAAWLGSAILGRAQMRSTVILLLVPAVCTVRAYEVREAGTAQKTYLTRSM